MNDTRAEMAHKHQQVVGYMEAHDLDAVVLTKRANFSWFTGGRVNHVNLFTDTGAASLVIMRHKIVCITNTIEGPRMAQEELADLGIVVLDWPWYDSSQAAKPWSQLLGSARVGCDAKAKGMPAEAKSLGADFVHLRLTLTEWEIERIKVLAKETAQCVEAVCRQSKRGVREYQLAGRLTGMLMERDIRVPVALVAGDERTEQFRHPVPTGKKIEKIAMIVCGAERGGLIASCSRLVSFGPISSELRRKHDAVCQIDAAMIGASRPGVHFSDIFSMAQKLYAAADYFEQWQYHHQGGSTGYAAREAKGEPNSKAVVQANQLFAWNPSISGTKSEDTILVGPRGNEILTTTGQWPTTDYPAAGRSWPRGNILSI